MPLSSDRHIADDQFRKKLQNYRVQPSVKVWNRLAAALHLQKVNQSNTRKLLLVVALVLLGSGGVWINSQFQPVRNTNLLSVQKPAAPDESTNRKEANHVEDQMPRNLNSEVLPINQDHTQSTESETIHPDYSPSSTTFGSTDELKSGNFVPDRNANVTFSWLEDAQDIGSLHLVESYVIQAPHNTLSHRHIENKSSPVLSINPKYYMAQVSGFYVGFGENFNNTHIIDKKAFHDENLKYTPTFGTALMVHGGYNLSNRWGVEAAWVIHSQEGQRYKYLPTDNRTTSLEYNQKHVSFNYMQFPVMARYKVQGWSGITETPIFVNYSLGFQYGRMLSYSVNETKERVSNQDIFRKDEYALVAGIDYDFISRRTAFYTLGIRASYGSNLFVKDVPEYLEFERPHNLLIGIHGAVNFSLGKAKLKPGL